MPDSAAHQGTVTLEGKVKKPPLALHSLLSEGTETPRQVCMAQLLGPAGKDFKNKCEFQLQHCGASLKGRAPVLSPGFV